MRLLECFAPLFAYGLLIDDQTGKRATPDGLASVHAHARSLVEQARKAALAEGKSLTDVEMAGFGAVAWFDEIVMRRENLAEHTNPLQLALFHTGSAATEFFDHLAGLRADTEEVREVYSMALLLGFVGQYYYEQGDSGELGRIKTLYCPPCVTASAVLQSLQRDAITPQPYLVPGRALGRLQGPWISRRPTLLLAAAIVLFVLIAFVAPVLGTALSVQAWDLLGLAVVAAGVMGWAGSAAWHELVVKRAHNRVAANFDAGYGIGNLWAAIADAARHARGAILHPFRRRGSWRQLSRHPWLLFLGDGAANIRGLLRAAAYAPHARALSGDEVAKPWHWWIFRSLVAIEPGTHLMQASEDEQGDDTPWSQALALLGRERRKLPLDGVVLCVAAQDLLKPVSAIESSVAKLHELADEVTQRLHLQLPLYVVVTGLESLPGYASFKATLPPGVFRRAFGLRIGGAPMVGGDAHRDVHLNDMYERMRTTGLVALAMQNESHGRREIFDFLQSLSPLQRGLDIFLDRLLTHDVLAERRLLWCGLYLTAGTDVDVLGGDFVDDLFNRFLPADWLLARRVA
jgi:type IV/VI secretion system ImpK/VasF family protein